MKKTLSTLNLILNKRDRLEEIEMWRVKAVRQDLKVGINSKAFRNYLLLKGMGHSFYQGFLWLLPLNKQELNEDEVKRILSSQFRDFGEIQFLEFPNFDVEEVWLSVGVVLLRDALRFSLYTKFKERKNIMVRKLRVYNTKEILRSWTIVYAILGISLSKIILVDKSNIGILPFLTYELYDNFDQRVEDKYERQKYLTMASNCDYEEFTNRLNRMVNLVFPLTVYFSNKTLTFSRSFYKLTPPKKKGKIVTGLDRWLS